VFPAPSRPNQVWIVDIGKLPFNPNSELRISEGRNPKAEPGFDLSAEIARCGRTPAGEFSGLGLRISFGSRISNFGVRVQPENSS
jgi:hypothetical protein